MPIIKQHTPKVAASNQLWIAGSFIPNGTGSIGTQYGLGYSVTRTSAGLFKVTLKNPFANFVSIVATPQFASANADEVTVKVGDISVSNKTFELKVLTSADTTTDHPDPDDISTSTTANKINFVCVVALADVPGAGV
jgi:hypothetical protein